MLPFHSFPSGEVLMPPLLPSGASLLRRRAEALAGSSSSLRSTLISFLLLVPKEARAPARADCVVLGRRQWSSAPNPSLSIWRRKKEMGKEGLFVVHELKRLSRNAAVGGGRRNPRLEAFVRSHVSRLVRTDLLAVLAELQRQDLVSLSLVIYDHVRREIWYKSDMYLYRDMILMLARNKKVGETRKVWADLQREGVKIDQHTYGDIVRAFLDSGLPELAMEFYDDMRSSSDPPLFLPFRVMLKGLIPYPELRERVKEDFLDLFPHTTVYDPSEIEDLFGERR